MAGEMEDSRKKFHCEGTGTNRAKVQRDLGLRYFFFFLDGKDLNTLRADSKEAGKREEEERDKGEGLGFRALGSGSGK